ncbi:MAG: Smr/MutS family protein [Caulobacteraceae bacterium]
MTGPLRDDDLRLWRRVTATLRPLPGRARVDPPPPKAIPPLSTAIRKASTAPAFSVQPLAPPPLEPTRLRRLARRRHAIGPAIDLHGLSSEEARDVLGRFLSQSQAMGRRHVLVITGKGLRGGGILRRLAPEWLAAPPLRSIVAGVAEAHRRHGGQGALYVALKRAPS